VLLNYLNDSIFRINMALDSGQSTTFDAVRKHIADGDIFEWLSSDFGCDFSIILSKTMRDEKAAITKALQGHAKGLKGRERRKLGVSNNGLCLLIGLVLDIISVEKIDVNEYENFLRGDRARSRSH